MQSDGWPKAAAPVDQVAGEDAEERAVNETYVLAMHSTEDDTHDDGHDVRIERRESKSIETVAFDQTLVTTTSSFIELPVNVQWGVDLLMLRPFVFASPYVGFNIGNKISGISGTFNNNKVTGGVGLGLGLEISKLQITAKYNWDFGGVASWNDYWSMMGERFKNLKLKEGSFHIGLAFIF